MKIRVSKKEMEEAENFEIVGNKRGQSETEPVVYRWEPTAKQIEVVRLLVDMEQRLSITDVCLKAGVGRSTLYRWLRNEEFKAYFNKLLGLETDIAIIEAWRCLLKAAKRGNVQAATKILEIKGMFTPKVKHEFSGDPDNPIRTEVYVPQFHMPPPPAKRVIDAEPVEITEDLTDEDI